jgi:hypothetical protein
MPGQEGSVMSMGGAGRFPKRAGRELVRNLIWGPVAYAPVAATLTLFAAAPLGGVLIFGGVVVPAMAALITVLVVWGGEAGNEAHDSGYYHHPGGYDYGICLGGGEGGHGGGDGGGGDGGG